ncbi:MAG: NADH-quinone oxidoreductase subunit J [Legionellaceae bacterium]
MTLPALPIGALFFYFFSTVLIISALMVISSTNPVRSALFLVLAFFVTAGLWLMLQAEFLALTLVLVYVGAVMTLFLFVIMTLNIDIEKRFLNKRIPLAIFIIALMVSLIITVLSKSQLTFSTIHLSSANSSNTLSLGSVLYTDYVYPFEIAGVLLLVAIVAAITLSFKEGRNRKVQQIEKQIAVKREDRVRLIKMQSEKKQETNTIGENPGKI